LAGFLLGIDFLSVNAHFKDPATCRDQRQRTNILFQPQKFFRQTDGLRLVVSNAAIFDDYFQSHTPGS
jgi:hypothetical protein